MLGSFIGFDSDGLVRWLKLVLWSLSGFFTDLTRQKWINFGDKEGNIMGEFFEEKKKEIIGRDEGGRGSGVYRFIKDIDYNGASKWKGKRKKKEKREEKIFFHDIEWKNVFVFAKIFLCHFFSNSGIHNNKMNETRYQVM